MWEGFSVVSHWKNFCRENNVIGGTLVQHFDRVLLDSTGVVCYQYSTLPVPTLPTIVPYGSVISTELRSSRRSTSLGWLALGIL